MTPEQRAMYDRLPRRMQEAVDQISDELKGMAIEGFTNADPRPWRVKPNPPTTPDRTTVDPRPRDFTDPTDESERYP